MTSNVDISSMSSDEIIDHYIKLLCKQAEEIKPYDVDPVHANALARLHMARSIDHLEYRVFHILRVLEEIRNILERKQ